MRVATVAFGLVYFGLPLIKMVRVCAAAAAVAVVFARSSLKLGDIPIRRDLCNPLTAFFSQ